LKFTTTIRKFLSEHVHLRDENGSAIIEFVALAIPLFIPVFIYINSFASISSNESLVRALSREGVRAYAASENDFIGRATSKQAIQVIAQHLGLSTKEILSLEAVYECSRVPCLSANSRIRLTISFTDDQTHRKITASAQENISPWR